MANHLTMAVAEEEGEGEEEDRHDLKAQAVEVAAAAAVVVAVVLLHHGKASVGAEVEQQVKQQWFHVMASEVVEAERMPC